VIVALFSSPGEFVCSVSKRRKKKEKKKKKGGCEKRGVSMLAIRSYHRCDIAITLEK
jgi:hypothetical protein